jgi:hypothetical protein
MLIKTCLCGVFAQTLATTGQHRCPDPTLPHLLDHCAQGLEDVAGVGLHVPLISVDHDCDVLVAETKALDQKLPAASSACSV